MNLANGLLNLTNWVGNVIMPTIAGLFAAAAIAESQNYIEHQQDGQCPDDINCGCLLMRSRW